jgi:hypothetical protein
MNPTARAAITNACLPSEEFQVQLAEAPTTAQPGLAAADQIFPTGSDQSDAATPELVSKDAARLAAARAEGRSEGFTAGRADRLTEGHAGGHAGVTPTEMSAYSQGRAAAQALLDIAIAAPAEMAKYRDGAAAAKAILSKVAGAPDEMGKYAAGAVAARALLGKPATAIEAKS